MTEEALARSIRDWDGKSAEGIRANYQAYSEQPLFLSALLSLLGEPELQKGASWLLKYYLEQGGQLNAPQLEELYALLPSLGHRESRLHILQSLSYLSVPASAKETLEQFLRQNLSDQNKFVRAWSYNGFDLLARHYPEYRQEAEQFMEMAMRDEAPSVKARIRNILKARG